MIKINEAPKYNLPGGIAIVIKEDNSLEGIVTDGDIRRALIKDNNIDQKVFKIDVWALSGKILDTGYSILDAG